jgi:SAM-dependent methyltransferase
MHRNHRARYHLAWSKLTPPVRPHADVVAAVRAELADAAGPTLLLGVTPEFADLSADLTAIDRNRSMVDHIWPGNAEGRRVVVADWRQCPFKPGSFSACVGDAAFGAMRFPDELTAACSQIRRALRPQGKLVCRVFVSPDARESVEAVRAAAASGAIASFHAFKFRLGMALIEDPARAAVGVDAIFQAFTNLFADRDALARQTGWPRDQIDTIDFYRQSDVAFHFPTRDALAAAVATVFPAVAFVESGRYELAERAPLLVAKV